MITTIIAITSPTPMEPAPEALTLAVTPRASMGTLTWQLTSL
ncbi:MAG: hypothetical protein Q4P07_14070 [Ornithinimicrobium sp.]|nr:hypothetical protein [Ornithinimicrobium sp.]MDO5741263.1 hypothetical protein [Ornithinimicrobium sp.]